MATIVLLCTDRVGFGHIRGMLAVEDALARIGVPTRSVFASQYSTALYRLAWRLVDRSLSVPYRLFPEHYARMRPATGARGMRLINTWLRRLDVGVFARHAHRNGHHIVVASHVTASHLIQQPDFKVYLLGLDPYAELYCNPARNVTTTAVDAQTQRDLYALGAKRAYVTGPMVPVPVSDARRHWPERLRALRSGAPLRIAIATGGSLTHGRQIAELSSAFALLTTPQDVESISVVVGNSLSMQQGVTGTTGGDARVSIVYDADPTRLVRKADAAIAAADVIIAKTGELAFCVAGGKVFKTFHIHPSLGPQEIAIKDYVVATSARDGMSALELGLAPSDEVARLLKQRADGSLFTMMSAGLSVPADGAQRVARMIQQEVAESSQRLVPAPKPTPRTPVFADGGAECPTAA